MEAVAGKSVQAKHLLAESSLLVDIGIGIGFTDHHDCDLFRCRVADLSFSDVLAVPEDRVAVGQGEHFRHLVGDKYK